MFNFLSVHDTLKPTFMWDLCLLSPRHRHAIN